MPRSCILCQCMRLLYNPPPRFTETSRFTQQDLPFLWLPTVSHASFAILHDPISAIVLLCTPKSTQPDAGGSGCAAAGAPAVEHQGHERWLEHGSAGHTQGGAAGPGGACGRSQGMQRRSLATRKRIRAQSLLVDRCTMSGSNLHVQSLCSVSARWAGCRCSATHFETIVQGRTMQEVVIRIT